MASSDKARRDQCVKKLRIHVRTTTILYGGIIFNSLFFFHMLSLCNFLLWVYWEWLALLIIPNYALFHTLQYFKDVQCHFWYPILLLSPIIIFSPQVFKIPYHLFAHILLLQHITYPPTRLRGDRKAKCWTVREPIDYSWVCERQWKMKEL